MNAAEHRQFADHLMAICPRADWPESEAWWRLVRDQLDTMAVDLPVAREAAKVLALNPPKFVSDILPHLLETVRTLRDQLNAARLYGQEINREEAEASSRGCVECGGHGLTSRDIEWEDRGEIRRGYAAFFCNRCDMGRWAKRQHEVQAKGGKVRIRDLADYPKLWRKDEAPEERLDSQEAVQQIRAMIARAAQEQAAKKAEAVKASVARNDQSRAAWEKRLAHVQEVGA